MTGQGESRWGKAGHDRAGQGLVMLDGSGRVGWRKAAMGGDR